MAEILATIFDDLKSIRTYLVKLGAKRRSKDICTKKYNEASVFYNEYLNTFQYLNKEVLSKKVKEEDIKIYKRTFSDIESIFEQIKQLCTIETLGKSEKSENSTMSTFDLKVALSLIPTMTNDEVNIKQIIDNIEYYDSVLENKECKANLINFVMKSRLSQSAKLKLNTTYASVSDLLKDMRRHLLSQKGSTALQIKLQNLKQNNLTIKDFGDELAELMTELTISQASNDSKNYNVLKPLNEKMAIKRFSDGLRNRRLSTIIAARNFEYLKDAVQAAIDEEVSSSTLTGEVLNMSSNCSTKNNSRVWRGNYYRQRGNNRAFPRRGPSISYGYARGAYQPSSSARGRGSSRAGYRGGANEAMLSATVAALACLCLARTSLADHHNLRLYTPTSANQKELTTVLANIEERLRILDTISATQVKQARRLDVIQDKLDRVETALSIKLERAQLAAERLEHRLHMLQTNVQTSIKESTDKLERSQAKLVELAQNLTIQIDLHRHQLDKVNGAYADTWHRGLVLESLMRDGLSLVNVTRRELADGLRALARRQRDARLTSADLEASFTRRLNDNTYKIDMKMQELLDAQKRFVDSCQRVQLDDPNQFADFLGKLVDTIFNKTQSTFQELQNIQVTIKNHDVKVQKLFNSGRNVAQSETCRRLENVMRNTTRTSFKENELQQLTEKLVDLTNRADAALQRLETRLKDEGPNVTAAADQLLLKLNGIKGENEDSDEEFDWEEDDPDDFYEDGGGDIMDEDKQILSKGLNKATEGPVVRPPPRRHLHKHPYDRGPGWGN